MVLAPILTVVAYVLATLVVQGTSHFAINAEHYAQLDIFRPDPLVPFGIASMLIQGAICAHLYPRLIAGSGSTPLKALIFAWTMGAFLVSYIAIALAGEYRLPSIGGWIAIEAAAGFAQFTLFGILLGLIHRRG